MVRMLKLRGSVYMLKLPWQLNIKRPGQIGHHPDRLKEQPFEPLFVQRSLLTLPTLIFLCPDITYSCAFPCP